MVRQMNNVELLQLVSGVVIVSFLLYVLSSIKISRLNKKYHELILKNKALQSDFSAMCSAAVNIGNKLDQLDTRFKALTYRQDKYEFKSDPRDHSYNQAKVLLNNGANIDDIVENCDMTYGEAEFIAMMQRLETKQSQH